MGPYSARLGTAIFTLLLRLVEASVSPSVVEVSTNEEQVLALARAGISNPVGRISQQLCASTQPGGFSGYHKEHQKRQGSACIVDDPSGSDAAMWLGYEDSGGLTMVPPRNPMTGRPYQDFGKLQRPKAAAVLEIRNGAVFDCEMGGTVFNSTLMMRLERWYYKPPPRVKPPALRVHHLGSPIVSLCVPYGYSYQHIMLDMVPKLSMLKPFLEKHPEVQLLHGTAAPRVLDYLGMGNAIEAKKQTVYTAPVVYMMHFHFSSRSTFIGLQPYGAADLLRESLFKAPVGPSGLASHLLPDTVLYLPRPQGSSRAVENEDELLRAIEAHLVPGIKLKKFIHVPGSHLSEDAAQFQTAKVVIGPHGGAWANIVFMPPGGQVIEFIPMGRLSRANPKANLRPCYYGLARACRLGYWMLEPRNFDFDRPQKMQVSVDEVLNGLRHIGVLRDGFAAQQVAQVEGGAQRTTRHSGLLPGSRFISGEMRKEKQGRITSHPISGAVRRRYRRVHGAE